MQGGAGIKQGQGHGSGEDVSHVWVERVPVPFAEMTLLTITQSASKNGCSYSLLNKGVGNDWSDVRRPVIEGVVEIEVFVNTQRWGVGHTSQCPTHCEGTSAPKIPRMSVPWKS